MTSHEKVKMSLQNSLGSHVRPQSILVVAHSFIVVLFGTTALKSESWRLHGQIQFERPTNEESLISSLNCSVRHVIELWKVAYTSSKWTHTSRLPVSKRPW